MYFELEVVIDRRPEEVFAFLRDKDLYPQEPGSPVLSLEQISSSPPGVGTRYREVVQMMPFVRGIISSEITRFEPPRWLEEDFSGAGMRGHLAYEFIPHGDNGTRLVQCETLETLGALRMLSLPIRRMLGRRLRARLDGIKTEMESGWVVQLER